MRRTTLVSALVVAIALAATMSTVSASDQPAKADVANASAKASEPSNTPSQFSTLKGVKVVPMASKELESVKGLHIHFATPSLPQTGLLFVNQQENNLGNGQAPLPGSGPGYSGLCGAALNSPALFIPGQNPTTGVGGGC